MSIFKNRTVIGVICILLALVICFGITPLFNQSISQKAEIVRVTKDIHAGELITRDMVTTAEVGSYNLPSGLMTAKDNVVGKYAKADLAVGDYILAAKLSDAPAAENAYLYNLDGTKQAISVTIKSFATGLSGKLQSGDIVSVIVADYPEDGETTIPAELQYVEIISVTASTGYDANTGEAKDDEKELPSTVTFLVLPEQAKVLAELEQAAKLHLALVYRGTTDGARQFIEAQDEGITGTSAAKREDFQRMMADCRRGLIDQILVKSISRFARNTKDCLEAVRELKELGVNVRFEREGIDTANVSSELITAIYAAFAQKESESISGNMHWSYQRRMESGEFNTCRAPWGFRLDGKSLAVHEEEAEIVRRIFLEYLSGRNPREIAEILNAEDTSGRIWKYKAVDYILQNERYAGNALLQKRYTTATLPKQQKINHGEREMYYVADSNEAIIPQELFDRAKELRQRRSVGQAVTHGRLCVQMRCSCGSRIRAKQVKGRWYWCCCRHDEKGDCAIKPVPEAQTDEAFRRLYYKLKHQSLPILEQMLETLRTIRDRRLLWSEDIVSLNKKISELSSQNQTLAFLKQNGLVDPDIFISKSNELTRQLRQAKLDKEKLMDAEGDTTAQRTQELIALLEDGPDFLDCPDTELCGALVAEIIVESNDTLRFRLHNGLELRESIERTVR